MATKTDMNLESLTPEQLCNIEAQISSYYGCPDLLFLCDEVKEWGKTDLSFEWDEPYPEPLDVLEYESAQKFVRDTVSYLLENKKIKISKTRITFLSESLLY